MNHTRASLALALVLLSAVVACNVDETGYIVPPEVDYTADTALAPDSDVPLLVVGRAGAITTGGGVLTVTNTQSGQSASVDIGPSGSFVVGIDGRLAEILELTYELGNDSDSFELTLDDDLTSVAPPGTGTGGFVSPSGTDGEVIVRLSQVSNLLPPVIIVNATGGLVTEVEDANADTVISAQQGDLICVYDRPDDALSQSLCQAVF